MGMAKKKGVGNVHVRELVTEVSITLSGTHTTFLRRDVFSPREAIN